MWNQLKQAAAPILLYGMGDGADKVLQQCRKRQIPISGVFASDGFARHNLFHGYTVISYSEAKRQYGDMIVLVCFGTHRPEVMALIEQVEREQTLYIPDVPVAGETVFDLEFVRAHRPELEQVYQMLADETSRQTFEGVIRFKLTGQPAYLRRCQSPPTALYTELLELGNRESYVDLGAYRGDTLTQFLQNTHRQYASILAVEPEPGSFQKLAKLAAPLPNCRCVQAVMAEKPGTVLFRSGRGRGSGTGHGGIEMQAESLDHLLQDAPVSYLNIDVEGNESLVIHGSKQSIRRHRPKILLAAYHRSEDLFSLPLQLREICPDYRVYLRHWPCYPAWDVNYIFL